MTPVARYTRLPRLFVSPRAVYLALAVVAAAIYLINLTHAPDFDADEVLYTLAGRSAASHDSLSFNGAPIYVHPPLFFIAVGGWLALLGDLHNSVVGALYDARYLNAAFCIGDALLTASLCRAWSSRVSRYRTAVVFTAGLLVALNPFMARFGRSVLIEPTALFFGMLAVRVAWALRKSSHGVYIPVYGALIGFAALTKETALAVAVAPVLAAILRRRRTEILRNIGALFVAAVIFSSFVLTYVAQGRGHALYDVQTLNVRRLLGLVHITGLNRGQGVSSSSAFAETFRQYSGGYFLLVLGGVALTVGVLRARQNFAKDESGAALLGFGVISYAFVLYSVFFGQSNEQLTVYAVPASALLAMLAWDVGPRPQRRSRLRSMRLPRPRWLQAAVQVVGLLIVLVAAATSWFLNMATTNDTAIAQTEQFISTSVPTCARIDATGDPFGWSATLRTNPVVEYRRGSVAVRHGVHVFLVSPKDDRFQYGKSSPIRTAWIAAHGRLVSDLPSHTYDRIQVWEVGKVPAAPPGVTASSCANPQPPAATHAKVSVFGAMFGLTSGVVAALTVVLWIRRRRHPAPHFVVR